MKRTLCLLLFVSVLFSLFGCTERNDDSLTFYYLRNEYSYGASDSVIASEQRDISTRRDELKYLLGLYLVGPLEDTLRSPFPRGTRLLDITIEEDTLTLQLSDEFAALEDVHLTLAGACIASTCFDLTDVSTVQIYTGELTAKPLVSLTRDSLMLLDSSTSSTETSPGIGN